MRSNALTGFLAAALLLISACGSGDTTTDDIQDDIQDDLQVAEPDDVQVPEDLRVIVVPDGEGGLPPDAELRCLGSPPFPASALDDVPLVADAGMEAAMATFLDTGEGSFWPQDQWRLLHEDDVRAVVVHAEPGGSGVSMITLERDGDQWRSGPASSGPCSLQPALPSGMNTVEWRLDPAAPAPTPDSTAIELLISEVDCVGGQAIGDRLLGPEVVVTDNAVLIAFAATSPPGDHTCPGNPEQPIVVELPQPLGDRVLVDGLTAVGDLVDFLDSESAGTNEQPTEGDALGVLGNQPGAINRTVSPSWVAEFEVFEDIPSLIDSVQGGGEAPEVSETMAQIMAAGLSDQQGLPYFSAAETAEGLVIAEQVDTRLDNGDSLSVGWRFHWADTPPCEICTENQVLWDNGWQVWTDADPERGMIRLLAEHATVPLDVDISYFPDPLLWPEALPENDPILATSLQEAETTTAAILDAVAAVISIPTD